MLEGHSIVKWMFAFTLQSSFIFSLNFSFLSIGSKTEPSNIVLFVNTPSYQLKNHTVWNSLHACERGMGIYYIFLPLGDQGRQFTGKKWPNLPLTEWTILRLTVLYEFDTYRFRTITCLRNPSQSTMEYPLIHSRYSSMSEDGTVTLRAISQRYPQTSHPNPRDTHCKLGTICRSTLSFVLFFLALF